MIIIFPANSESIIQEIYALPIIILKDMSLSVLSVKLGIPAKSKDGRLAFAHLFAPIHIDWLLNYVKGNVEIIEDIDEENLAQLPKDWEPIDETDIPPELGDLELTTKPINPGAILEPDDKTEWEKSVDEQEVDSLREIRKQQWQSTLPDKEFVKE